MVVSTLCSHLLARISLLGLERGGHWSLNSGGRLWCGRVHTVAEKVHSMSLLMHASTTAAMQEGSANPSAGVPRLHMVVMDDVELDGLTSQTSASSKAFP
jgi:hypothetical protein